jgi:hypothetical protein
MDDIQLTLGDADLEARVRAACKRLCPHSELALLPRYEPQGWAKPNCCFANTAEQVRRCGGSVEYGWLLALHPRMPVLLAISHAVWRSPAGEVIDITPRRDPSLMPAHVISHIITEGGSLWLADPAAEDRPRKYLPLRNNDNALARKCRVLSRQAWDDWHHGDRWAEMARRFDAYEKRGQPT